MRTHVDLKEKFPAFTVCFQTGRVDCGCLSLALPFPGSETEEEGAPGGPLQPSRLLLTSVSVILHNELFCSTLAWIFTPRASDGENGANCYLATGKGIGLLFSSCGFGLKWRPAAIGRTIWRPSSRAPPVPFLENSALQKALFALWCASSIHIIWN